MSPAISALAPHYTTVINQNTTVINQMPSTFTAHEFIQTLSQQHQALYIEALHHYVGSEEPFTTVHQMLGQQLHDFSHLIKKIGDVPSNNLFNKDSTVS